MTLHQKTTGAVIATFLCLSTALHFISQRVMGQHQERLEEMRARENVQRVRDASAQRLARLSSLAQAWAWWNDTYQFALGQNQSYYRRTNLSSAALVPMQSDVIAIVKFSGEILDLTGYSIAGKKRTAPPPFFKNLLLPDSPLLKVPASGKPLLGYTSQDTPMLLVAHPVLRTDGTGPPVGALILGRYIDEAETKALIETIHQKIVIRGWNEADLPPDFTEARASLARKEALSVAVNANVMAGYGQLNGIDGRPAILFRVDESRDLFRQAQLSLRTLQFSMIAMGVAFGLVMLVLVNRVVLQRINRLSTDLDAITAGADPGGRVRVEGQDEISRLAGHFNRTLQALQETQRELNEREKQFAHIAANVPGLVYRLIQDDNYNLSVVFVNEGSRQVFGIEPELLRSQLAMVIDWIHPDDKEHFQRSWQQSTESLSKWRWEGRICLPDGTVGWIQALARPEKLEDGNIVWDGIIVDITDRKKAEAALQLAHDELETHVAQRTAELARTNESLQSEIAERKMMMGALADAVDAAQFARQEAEAANHAKSQFLSRMSHELRTPLNAIIGFSQLLELDDLTPDQRESVDQVLRGGRHLLELINEVLDIARIEAQEFTLTLESVDVQHALEDAIGLMQPLAQTRNVQLHNGAEPTESDAEQNRLYVWADRQRLRQVLLNLLSNAINYNREGGEVWVASELIERQHVRIRVRDTGQGIAPDKMPQLFTPFDRLGAENTDTPGTGIGLTLSKHLVEKMNGAIGVESEIGKGSSFWFDLPQAGCPDECEENTNGHTSVPERVNSGEQARLRRKILYIEDNLSNVRLVERILAQQPDVALLTAMQGNLAMALAHEHQPQLILLDAHLPDIEGREVLRRLKRDPATRSIPVIVVSADATDAQIAAMTDAGAHAYLTKPFDVPAFLRTIKPYLS